MAPFDNDYDPAHLEGARLRANAIRAQIELAVSFCNLVPTELGYGHVDEARKLMEKAQHVAEVADQHIREESHVPPKDVPALKEQLRKLELLIDDTQRKLAA